MELFSPHFKNRYRVIDGKASIELKLKTPNQLFDERDPSPFRERDLDDDAATYIISSYRELSSDREASLALYFASMGEFEGNADVIRKAIHSHFEYEAELKRRELRETFRQGFISLGIGLTFLLVCTWFSHSMHKGETVGLMRSLVNEWLYIVGLVGMWKPISIFLYEWWPIRSEMASFLDLSRIQIEIQPLELMSTRREASAGSRTDSARPMPLANFKTS